MDDVQDSKLEKYTTRKGGTGLILEGYCYKVDRLTHSKCMWRCCQNYCPGRCTTDKESTTVLGTAPHNHPQLDPTVLVRRRLLSVCKQKAQEMPFERASKIVSTEMAKHGSFDQRYHKILMDSVYRARVKQRHEAGNQLEMDQEVASSGKSNAAKEGKHEQNKEGSRHPNVQVKEEPADNGYEHCSPTSSNTSSPLPPVHFGNLDTWSSTNPAADEDSQPETPSSQINSEHKFDSLPNRTEAPKTSNNKGVAANKSKKLTASSYGPWVKPHIRKQLVTKRCEPAFPATGQESVFPVSGELQARLTPAKSGRPNTRHCVSRPKSPTRSCDQLLKDKTHFSYALMELSADGHGAQEMFKVQTHELVCAIGSKSIVTDGIANSVAALDFGDYWCNFCQYTTNNKSQLIQHVLEHRFRCKYCSYESFCRSDTMRHMYKMHPNFASMAHQFQYCTLLSDYARVKGCIDGKKDTDPDRDVGDPDSSDIEAAIREQNTSRKRDYAIDGKGDGRTASPEAKKARSNSESFSATPSCSDSESSVKEKAKSRKSQNPRKLVLPTSTPAPAADLDYDVFDMEVEEISPQDSEKNFEYSGRSSPDPDWVPPHSVEKSLSTPTPIHSSKPNSTPSQSSLRSGTEINKVNSNAVRNRKTPRNAAGSSSLYWSCGYCNFQSSGQAEVKVHSSKEHPGKPHRYVALIKDMTPDTIKSKAGPNRTTPGKVNKQCLSQCNASCDGRNNSDFNVTAGAKGLTHVHTTSPNSAQFRLKSSDNTVTEIITINQIESGDESDGSPSQPAEQSSNSSADNSDDSLCSDDPTPLETPVSVVSGLSTSVSDSTNVDKSRSPKETSARNTQVDSFEDFGHDFETGGHHTEEVTASKDSDQSPIVADCKLEDKKELTTADSVNTIEDESRPCASIDNDGQGQDECLEKDIDIGGSQTPDLVDRNVGNVKNVTAESSSQNNSCSSQVQVLLPEKVNSSGSQQPHSSLKGVDDRIRPMVSSVSPEHISNPASMKTTSPQSPVNSVVQERVTEDIKCNNTFEETFGEVEETSSNDADRCELQQIECKNTSSKDTAGPSYKSDLQHQAAEVKGKESELRKQLGKLSRKSKKEELSKLGRPCPEDLPHTAYWQSSNSSLREEAKHCTSEKYAKKKPLLVKFSLAGPTTKCTLSFEPINEERCQTSKAISEGESKNLTASVSGTSHCTNETQSVDPELLNELIDSTDETDPEELCDATKSQTANSCTSDNMVNNPSKTSSTKEHIKKEMSTEEQSVRKVVPKQEDLPVNIVSPKGGPNQVGFSCVPARSAATKALEKMKPVVVDDSESSEASSGDMRKKLPLKMKQARLKMMRSSSLNLDVAPKMKAKLTPHGSLHSEMRNKPVETASFESFSQQNKMSTMYMCQYCIDFNAGPLWKTKRHVLQQHRSMPPVVINCARQRRHLHCRFYVCSHPTCFVLLATIQDLNQHKSTHHKVSSTHMKKAEDLTAVSQEPQKELMRPCRVELRVLDQATIDAATAAVKHESCDMFDPEIPQTEDKPDTFPSTSETGDFVAEIKTKIAEEPGLSESQSITALNKEASKDAASVIPQSELELAIRSITSDDQCDNSTPIEKVETVNQDDNQTHLCGRCEMTFNCRAELEAHSCTGNNCVWQCAVCGWFSPSHKTAASHLQTLHSPGEGATLVRLHMSVDENGHMCTKVI